VYVVRKQPNPLAIWYASEWQPVLEAWERSEARRLAEQASRPASAGGL
jgi:hypothetical protein